MIQILICSLNYWIEKKKKKKNNNNNNNNKYHIINYDKSDDRYSKKCDIALLIFHRSGATCMSGGPYLPKNFKNILIPQINI